MSRIAHHGAFFWECFQGVSRDEPGGFDIIFVEEFQETADADCARPEAWEDLLEEGRSQHANGGMGLLEVISLVLPRLISFVLSSPPYDPSQPATASMSTP